MKRKIFLDTNIVIDYLANRVPFGEEALQIFSFSPRNNQLCISALSFTTIFYVLRKHYEHGMLMDMLSSLEQLVEVLPTDEAVIALALRSEFTDFEDAVQYYTALAGNVSVIITRNPRDFRKSMLPIYTPSEFLQIPHWMGESDDKVLNEPEMKYGHKD